MKKFNPDVVLNIGQTSERFDISIERVAINLDDARIPDNEGNQPIDETIRPDGSPAYFSSLPIKVIVENIKNSGIPVSVSNTAGTFVCNHIMYQNLYFIEKEFPQAIGRFIHIPFLPDQVVNKANQPSISLENITRALELAIKTLVEFRGKDDLKTIGGQIYWIFQDFKII